MSIIVMFATKYLGRFKSTGNVVISLKGYIAYENENNNNSPYTHL